MVVLQQATEPLARHNAPLAFRLGRYGQNQLIVQALMVPLVMIMRNELAHRPPERPFTNENQAVQTRFFDASYEALRVRVEIREKGRQSDGFNTRAGQCLAERDRDLSYFTAFTTTNISCFPTRSLICLSVHIDSSSRVM
jgi:hypothetical protein